MLRPVSALAFLALAACAAEDPAEIRPLGVHELAPPAGEGSGEPYVSSAGDAVLLSWLETSPAGGHDVKVARLEENGWGEPRTVAHGEDFFVNWADFPSVATGGDGALWAHWLRRKPGEGLAYDILVARSTDDGATWSEPWTPHGDGTPTEHGFVSLFPWGDGVGMTWLDGRQYAPGPGGEEPTREMTVRFRRNGASGPGEEILVDARVCDCCQTDVAVAPEGPVLVYRNRTQEEVRDVYVARWTPEGWTEGVAVHDDGWVIGGCPVNGPAIDAHGATVAVAWFTGAGDVPRVRAAFSQDGGRTFGAPVQVDDGNPAGRVDVRLLDDGRALVSWLERTEGDAAEVRLAAVGAAEGRGEAWTVSRSSSARASGFPRMSRVPWDPSGVILAWTDVSDPERSRIRVAHVELPR